MLPRVARQAATRGRKARADVKDKKAAVQAAKADALKAKQAAEEAASAERLAADELAEAERAATAVAAGIKGRNARKKVEEMMKKKEQAEKAKLAALEQQSKAEKSASNLEQALKDAEAEEKAAAEAEAAAAKQAEQLLKKQQEKQDRAATLLQAGVRGRTVRKTYKEQQASDAPLARLHSVSPCHPLRPCLAHAAPPPLLHRCLGHRR